MARTMAADEKAYRAVVRVTRIGPDVYATRRWDNSTYLQWQQGKVYREGIWGPYSTPGSARGMASRETATFVRENSEALQQGLPEPWEIIADIEVADITWTKVPR